MTELEALKRAVSAFDTQAQLAEMLSQRMGIKITQGQVANWIHRSKRLPERYVLHVVALAAERGVVVQPSDLCALAFPKHSKAA